MQTKGETLGILFRPPRITTVPTALRNKGAPLSLSDNFYSLNFLLLFFAVFTSSSPFPLPPSKEKEGLQVDRVKRAAEYKERSRVEKKREKENEPFITVQEQTGARAGIIHQLRLHQQIYRQRRPRFTNWLHIHLF